MNRADLIKILRSTELEGGRNLTRIQARAVVDEIFKAITETLQNGEAVHLPLGSFRVCESDREPIRRWYLGRVRVTYKQRKRIEFEEGVEYDLEPDPRRPSDTSLALPMPARKEETKDDKLSPSERRKLALIGVKAGKSKRSIAREVGVSEATIRRDLKNPAKPAKKKRTAKPKLPVRRKVRFHRKDALKESTSKATVPHERPLQKKKTILPISIPAMPRPLREELKRRSESKKPKTPEEVRQQRLQEMIQSVQSWLEKEAPNYWRAIDVVDKARNRLNASSYGYFQGIPVTSKSAAELRDQTRPAEMDSAASQIPLRREEICAQWLARWIAYWEPRDDSLRNELLNLVRAKQPVYSFFG